MWPSVSGALPWWGKGDGQRLTPPPARRQAVHRAETLSPAKRLLRLTSSARPAHPGPGPPLLTRGWSCVLAWWEGTVLQPGPCSSAWQGPCFRPASRARSPAASPFSRLWLALGFRTLEGLHRTSTQAGPRCLEGRQGLVGFLPPQPDPEQPH